MYIPHFENIPEVCPLSEAQKGIYLECLNEPESLMYNIPVLCRLPKNTDRERFIAAIKTAAGKHKALNVTVSAPDGVPSMILHDGDIAVSRKTADSIKRESRDFIRPFDLENGPLYRFEYLDSPEGPAFLFDVHHLVFDGTSVKTFVSQIINVYTGGECPEEELTVFDVANAEISQKETEEYHAAQDFFKEKLDGADCDSRPIPDQITEDTMTGAGMIKMNSRDRFLVSDILKYTSAHKINENALFLGAFSYALSKFSGTAYSFFTTAHHGRMDKRLASAVGMFVKTLPLYYTIDEKMKVSDFLSMVYDDYYRTKHHSCISFGELASQYGVNTDISFIYQSEFFNEYRMDDTAVYPELLHTGDTHMDLDVMLMKIDDHYELMSHFRKSVYTEELVRSFAAMYINVIRGMLTADTLGDIPLTDEKSKAVLDSFNKTEADYDTEKTVVELFCEQAKKTPDNICLVYCDKRYTYREVDEITDNLAGHLIKNGIGKEKVVGVLIPRCEHMLICSLGVLKAGGAYLPLDPTYPPERLNLMMQDSGAMMLIYAPELGNIITSDFTGMRMTTDEISALPACNIELPTPHPHDLFVMLYTSGSTGTPKGVMFEHGNALVTTEWVKKYFDMDEQSRVTAYASYGFDAHSFDIYPAVTSGAELHIISDEIRLDFPALKRYFNENKITHTVMTTQIGRQFALMGGFSTLRHLSVAGEKLTPPDVPEGFKLYNLYGPTEGSVITSAFYIDRRYKDVPIGKPVENLKLYVVDKNGKLLPAGAAGELWIAGPHVTRGYLNRPEKTAEAYGENPFCREAGYERIYRTGDIVRLLSDGNLQFVGRRDMQVKVRGFRVELTEIEEVIRRFPKIKDATVAAFDDPSGGKYIAAYVVADEEIDTYAMNEFIRAEKPPYMVPAVTMQIERIPLNQNGKVNKKALPVPQRKAEDSTPPENEAQQKIFDIVSDVIGHTQFGINTGIYDAGLTSIGAVRLNVVLAETFDVPIKISDIKANDTVKKLERFISESAPQKSYELLPDYPITETQNGIFVECMAAPDTTVYNIPVLFRLGENVELKRLSAAVKTAIDAHPYAKTTLFTDAGGNIRAARNDKAYVEAPIIKCDALPEISELVRPYKLLDSALYRIAIYETANGNYIFMDFHHIISDGTSEALLLRDINRAYVGEKPETERFSGFEAALEEKDARNGERYEKAKAYWTNLLSDSDGSSLPQKAPEDNACGAGYFRVKGAENAASVKSFCNKNGFTVNAFFNAAFSLVLSRFTGKDSVSYATIYNGRSDSRLSETVTMLVKTLPTAIPACGDTAVAEHIRAVQSQLMNSMANDICSFAELVSWFGVNSELMFAYQGEDFTFDTLCGEPAHMVEITPERAKAALAINVYLAGGHFEYTAEYRREAYCADMVGSMIEALMTVVEAFMTESALKDISLLSDSAEALYAVMNGNDTPVENTFCHQFIERWAEITPDRPAVIAAGESITFRELCERANIMAHALTRLGAGRDNIIGLVLERTKEVMITELAVMKSGGAFLPMIPSYPDERIDFCLTNAESPFVITTEAIKKEKAELFAEKKPYKTVTVEQLLAGNETENLNLNILPDQMAYCIYTSGSTGTPKGVMIEHHSMSNFVQTDILPLDYYTDPNTDGACLNTSSISFDMSLYESWMPLCAGKTVCMATEEEFHNPLMLRELMLRNKVQAVTFTPSFLNNMLSMPGFEDAIRGLRTLVAGAEAFPSSLYDALRKISPDMQIVNGYGPTETTICCSMKELHSGNGITIGRPAGNMKYYVLDRFGHVQPPYAVGELIICGPGVGRGYVRLPEKTEASFFKLRGLPAYRSGDLVRLTKAAEIEFGGRMDNQVKLRGFRVELDEIENVMCSYGPVKQSKVLVRNNGTEDYLVGFFTANEQVNLDELTAHMKSRLTYYMVPSALMQLERMPLTPNGKIDKKAFPEVKQTAGKTGGRRAAKKSLEQRLCEIFASVLGMEEVFADDNFFELGGTSLSASKVTMVLMSEGIEVKYGDIFANPTPEALSEFIERRDADLKAESPAQADSTVKNATRDTLRWNAVKYASEVKREPLGNVLLTGAVGFLGIHILNELISSETGHIYCLVRKGTHETAEIRLKTMLIYYFSSGFDDALRDRITVIDADITDETLGDTLRDVPFDTVINCAACVKHFSDTDVLEKINVSGVENLISICKRKNAKLIQISTVSVPGIHTPESYEKQIRMHENELFVIDDMDNKYGISKYHAELRMFDAIDSGMRGKVIRVGNLMGRHSDGEFQANMETNMFMSGIRGFATMGKYPISHMTDPMRFSPVDCTARAVVLLSGVNDKFTAFNADNRYGFDEMKIIDACNRNGITIIPAADEDYYAEYRQKLGDDRINSRLNGLAAYDIQDAHAVDTDNLFTTNILYRIGFSWPLVDDTYLDRAINSIMTLDYFNVDDAEETEEN